MTLQIGLLFLLLAAMVALFLTEKLPVDLTAFAGLVVLVFAGYVKPEEAFAGFSSNAVITMLSVFFVSAGLQYTGVAEAMGSRIHRVVGSREVPLIVAIMLVAGVLSAFMNNIAAAAVLMPAVASLARQAGVAPSRLMMPLAYGAVLGGTTTLVGTPPNLLTTQVLTEQGLAPFALFDFAPYGLALLAAGVVYMATLGRTLLPAEKSSMAERERSDLASVYRIGERLFSLRIPEGSPLAGQRLDQARLDRTLGVQVVAIGRDGAEQLAPSPEEVLRAGDSLVVEGQREELAERLALQQLEVQELGKVSLGLTGGVVSGLLVRLLPGSPLAGRSLRELAFGRVFRVAVAGIWRGEERVERGLADHPLQAGDAILALGQPRWTNDLAARPDLELLAEGDEALGRLHAGLFAMRVPEDSTLAGATVGQTRLRERFDITVVCLVRDGATELVDSPEKTLQAGDRLLISGRPRGILRLLQVGQLEVAAEEVSPREIESEDVGLVEAVVAPRSSAVGRSLQQLSFRARYGLRALAVWRGGESLRDGLPRLKLRLGDGLLLHGPREKAALLDADPDFVVLSGGTPAQPQRTARAPLALGALLLMVALVVSGLFPIQVASFAAATLVVLSGALKMEEAYRAVEWRAVFLVAAILPVGAAMERTGAAELLADTVAGAAGGLGPQAVLLALMVLSSLLSQGLDGAPTVVLLGPVVVGTAQRLAISPYPLMMGVGLAASAAFMTPFSHKANLLVMGAGGYRSLDYLKVGSPLTAVVIAILALMIPWLLPFTPVS